MRKHPRGQGWLSTRCCHHHASQTWNRKKWWIWTERIRFLREHCADPVPPTVWNAQSFQRNPDDQSLIFKRQTDVVLVSDLLDSYHGDINCLSFHSVWRDSFEEMHDHHSTAKCSQRWIYQNVIQEVDFVTVRYVQVLPSRSPCCWAEASFVCVFGKKLTKLAS